MEGGDLFDLRGRVAVVTGGSRIGQAMNAPEALWPARSVPASGIAPLVEARALRPRFPIRRAVQPRTAGGA